MRRYALRDDQWDRIKDILPGREGHVGGTAASNRLSASKPFSSGFAPASRGRDLPSALATGRSSISASTDGPKSGVFQRVFRFLASDHDNEYMMIDATIVRAHQHSAGARKTARRPSVDPAAD